MDAEQLMTINPVVVKEDASLGEALELIVERGIRHLPVVRNGEIVGILSDRDLRGLGISLAPTVEEIERTSARMSIDVSRLMSADVITVDRATTLRDMVDIILNEKVGALPVIDSETNELVGIVSYVDILQALKDQSD
jgi:CBS domain-containing membrane protein